MPLAQAFSDDDGLVLGALPPLSQTNLKCWKVSQQDEAWMGVRSGSSLPKVSLAPLWPAVPGKGQPTVVSSQAGPGSCPVLGD